MPAHDAVARASSFTRPMTGQHETTETVLDLRGLRCPHPVLRAKKALRNVPVRGVLVLECTDPLTLIDVPHFVNQTGHLLEAQEQIKLHYLEAGTGSALVMIPGWSQSAMEFKHQLAGLSDKYHVYRLRAAGVRDISLSHGAREP